MACRIDEHKKTIKRHIKIKMTASSDADYLTKQIASWRVRTFPLLVGLEADAMAVFCEPADVIGRSHIHHVDV